MGHSCGRRCLNCIMFSWPLLFLALSGGVGGDYSEKNERYLKNDLFGDYEADKRPVKDQTKGVTVTVQMILEYLFIDDASDLITVNFWWLMTWHDEYLGWSPANYGGIDKIQVDNYRIWSPNLFLYNADITYHGLKEDYYDICNINSSSIVSCTPYISHTALCVPDPTLWPYDYLNCTLQFGSWTHTADQLNFVFADQPILINYYQDNREWRLDSAKTWKNPEKISLFSPTYPSLNLSFLLKRKNAVHTAIIIIPALAMVLLTTASSLLAPGGLRISVALMSLLAQMIYIAEISHTVPSHSDYPANIIKFFRDSIIITTLSILVSMVMMAVTKFTRPPPRLVGFIVNISQIGPVKYITFGQFDSVYEEPIAEDGEDTESNKLVQEKTANIEWRKFSTIFINISFIITIFVYILLIFIYVF